MSQNRIVQFPTAGRKSTGKGSNSVWTLFVLEDLRQHFLSTREDEALAVIEVAIQDLERVLMPD